MGRLGVATCIAACFAAVGAFAGDVREPTGGVPAAGPANSDVGAIAALIQEIEAAHEKIAAQNDSIAALTAERQQLLAREPVRADSPSESSFQEAQEAWQAQLNSLDARLQKARATQDELVREMAALEEKLAKAQKDAREVPAALRHDTREELRRAREAAKSMEAQATLPAGQGVAPSPAPDSEQVERRLEERESQSGD